MEQGAYDGPPVHARASSKKGAMFDSATRRRGRPAHMRSPDDSPLRDGNRDRVMGLLTERAAKTLTYYFQETNLNYHHWLGEYIKTNPIPRDGKWDDVSGETFLRQLLMGGVTEAKAQVHEDLFSCVKGLGIDPRAIAQRIMDIRKALAEEFIQDMQGIAEENAILMRECAMASLASVLDPAVAALKGGAPLTAHPELMDSGPVTIPNTAGGFVTEASESALERFQRQRGEDADSASAAADAALDAPRPPGLDDVDDAWYHSEFESELEATDMWKRRFRLMKQDGAAAGGQAAPGKPSDGVDQGSSPTAQGEDASEKNDGSPGIEPGSGPESGSA